MFADDLLELEFQEQDDKDMREAERKELDHGQLLTVCTLSVLVI